MSLNFREKRQLQKTVAEQQAALRGGELGFREKRQAQKAMREALTNLGAGSQNAQDGGGKPNIDTLPTRLTDTTPMDAPSDWIVMNAPRPLAGHKTLEGGDFMAGRFYAAIDPNGEGAASMVENNRSLDARVIMTVSKETQAKMALVGNKYADKYRDLAEERGEPLHDLPDIQVQIDRLQDSEYQHLQSLLKQEGGENDLLGGAADTAAGDTPASHERIKSALESGDARGALEIAQGITDRASLGDALLRAGLSVASQNSISDMLEYAWPQMQQKASEANPAPEGGDGDDLPEIPGRARAAFDRLVLPLTGVAEGLESARATDRKFNGDGRYAGEFMAKEETRERLANAEQAIRERLARIEDEAMGKAAQGYIDAQRPDLTLTQAEQEWRDGIVNDEPDADGDTVTLTAQAARGDFNALPLPEFIERLKEAYGADEDLEGAKEAAMGYLTANRDELEAA